MDFAYSRPMRSALFVLLIASSALADEVLAAHALDLRPSAFAGKFELLAYPAQVQVNGKFTQHVGAGLGFIWHPQENFGLQVSGFFNGIAEENQFNVELMNKVRSEAQAHWTLLNDWGALAAAEVTPFHGKFEWREYDLFHFSLLLFGGGGAGGTRHQLKAPSNSGPATFGDTGIRPLATVGAGVRLEIGEHLSVRLELRDLFYSGRIGAVNGCTSADLESIRFNGPDIRGACRIDAFRTSDPNKANDAVAAQYLLQDTRSGLIHNLGLQLGIGLLF